MRTFPKIGVLFSFATANRTVMFAVFSVPALLIMCAVIIRAYTTVSSEVADIREEVVGLKTSLQTVQANSGELRNRLDTYNEILTTLIPEEEDYFSLIFALEQISRDTGFSILRYTISLDDSTEEKLAVSIEGVGDSVSFLRFLESYRYEGGRLITSEHIEAGSSNEGRTVVSLNFYHKALTNLSETIEPIPNSEIARISEIEKKVNVSIKSNESVRSIQYPTKENPF